MPLYLPILALGLMMLVPSFFAGLIFFTLLHLWVTRLLRTDPTVHDRLRIETTEDSFGWALTPADRNRHWPFAPLIGTAIAAVVLTAGETAMFVFASDVPRFWYLSGA